MDLTAGQLAQFHRDGYVFLPEMFTAAEAAVLRAEADTIYAMDREEVWWESSGAPRTAFAAHTYSEPFRRLGRHPRLIRPVEQVLGDPVYMHQFKVNAKAAFDGEVWQWHQDYGTWQRDDAMPEPLAMKVAVFLDEVSAANQSQKDGAQHRLASPPVPLAPKGRSRTLSLRAGQVGRGPPTRVVSQRRRGQVGRRRRPRARAAGDGRHVPP